MHAIISSLIYACIISELRKFCPAFVYARHSQTTVAPRCTDGHTLLWDGYSLLHTEDEGRANVQDLGKAGSCLGTFSTMPFMFCNTNGVCTHARRTATSYWLASHRDDAPMMPVADQRE
jgi:collagen type IV alpha